MASEMNISGLKELDLALKQFTPKVEGNIVRGGVRAGTSVFLKRARSYINNRTGELSRSLRIRTKSKRGHISATLVAGNAKAFYAHMVEFGTARHLIFASDKEGKNVAARINRPGRKNAGALAFGSTTVDKVEHPGASPSPFMRPALDGGEQEAVAAMAAYIRARIEKEKLK